MTAITRRNAKRIGSLLIALLIVLVTNIAISLADNARTLDPNNPIYGSPRPKTLDPNNPIYGSPRP